MAGAEASPVAVEVVYALAERQTLIALQVPGGCTAAEAIRRSGLLLLHPDLAADLPPLAVFGRRAPASQVLRDGDRVELLRPLQADPKERRRAQVRVRRRR